MEDFTKREPTLPLARKDDLVVEHLADETLVYDLRSHKAHCLNAGAAFVWQHCNGDYDKAELTSLLHQKLGTPNDDSVVDLALQELSAAKLLVGSSKSVRISRREATKRLRQVFGASVLVPTVLSIVAPHAASAGSIQCPQSLCLGQACKKSNGKDGKCVFTHEGKANQACICK